MMNQTYGAQCSDITRESAEVAHWVEKFCYCMVLHLLLSMFWEVEETEGLQLLLQRLPLLRSQWQSMNGQPAKHPC